MARRMIGGGMSVIGRAALAFAAASFAIIGLVLCRR
jgi:hypothetical protein